MGLTQFFGQKLSANPENNPKFSARPIRIHSVTVLEQANLPQKNQKSRIAFEVTDPPGPYSMQFLTVLGGSELKEKLPVDATATYFESRDGATFRAIKSAEGVLYQEIR
ncbi:MAG: hypothetical protein ACFCU1_00475 [Sumerlaeia bacterium]